MREERVIVRYKADVISSEGELTPIEATKEIQHRYYSIKNINSKVNVMDLITKIGEVCGSGEATKVMAVILDNVDRTNMFDCNISKFCKVNGIRKATVTSLLKKSVENGLMKRIDRGVYMVNPYLFLSKGSTNQLGEDAQRLWSSYNLKEVK